MSLRANIILQRGALALEAEFELQAGETVALVGPNGAGKSSILMALAGLLRIERGSIEVDGVRLDGRGAKGFVPPEARDMGVVFQDHRLFPHLSVLENTAFGLRSRGTPRREACAVAGDWLDRVGVGAYLDAKPGALSGGQAQRVALARALAMNPRVLLLDEPLAAVDASAKRELLRDLRRHLGAFSGLRLVVVHEIGEALALAERVLVLEAGRIVQGGGIRDLVTRPVSAYVADLVGINCFRGICRDGAVALEKGELVVASPTNGAVFVTVHPRAVSLFRDRPSGSPRNVWRAPVVGVEPMLDRFRVQVGGSLPIVAEVTGAAVADLGLIEGREVWVAVKATEIVVVAE